MFVAYSKEIKSKVIFDVNLTKEEIDSLLGGDPYKAYPNLEVDKANIIIMEIDNFFSNPTYDSVKDTIREMTKYELYQNGLYALSFNEKEYKGDIITLEPGQYIDPQGELVTVPKIEGFRIEWNWETNIWEEKATEYEMVEMQYREYDPLDKPSVLKEMRDLDPALEEELLNLLIESRQLMDQLREESTVVYKTKSRVPTVSEKLKLFKEKRKDI